MIHTNIRDQHENLLGCVKPATNEKKTKKNSKNIIEISASETETESEKEDESEVEDTDTESKREGDRKDSNKETDGEQLKMAAKEKKKRKKKQKRRSNHHNLKEKNSSKMRAINKLALLEHKEKKAKAKTSILYTSIQKKVEFETEVSDAEMLEVAQETPPGPKQRKTDTLCIEKLKPTTEEARPQENANNKKNEGAQLKTTSSKKTDEESSNRNNH
ncbi:nucleolar protein 58-like [Ambystoma mexicanum]|uniref:nucleolar protein 58-like n=1 Tax=Ambystoma mexicanum TaxID=8296 RepID=UPI0037E7AC6F